MSDIYTTSRDVWGLRLECSRSGLLIWVASAYSDVLWWAEALVFSTPHFASRIPRSLDCLEFA